MSCRGEMYLVLGPLVAAGRVGAVREEEVALRGRLLGLQ